MLKELLFTGVGAAVLLREKVENEIKKLEENGKIKTDDAHSFLESLEAKGKEEDQKIHDKLKSTLKEIIDELGLATKEDLDKLKASLQNDK